jgi:NADH-quinone oxidoreductase subunit J
MNILFYISAVIAVVATLRMITGKNAVHALLYLIVSLLAVSVIFFLLGAPFVAALEVIIYAGAIMVLFVFVIMMLNVSGDGIKKENALLTPGIWVGPSIVTAVLLLEMIYMLVRHEGSFTGQPGASGAAGAIGSMGASGASGRPEITPAAVGALLFTKYIIVVELAAFLLAAGIIGAYHLGQKEKVSYHRYLKKEGGPV